MALYVDPPDFVLSANFLALSSITGWNGSYALSSTTLLGTPVLQLTYDRESDGFGERRIEAIANVLPNPIVLSAKNSTFTFPDGTLITNVGAGVLLDEGVQILVWDQTACNGEGYHVFAATGKPLDQPMWVSVAHELSHAYHNAVGDSPSDLAASETQATLEENLHRAQHGLPPRDPLNHSGGCGSGPVLWWLPALLGVEFVLQLLAGLLRTVDDGEDESHSIPVAMIRERLALEHKEFGSDIRSNLITSPVIEEAFSEVVMRPLRDFYSLAAVWLQRESTEAAFQEHVRNSFLQRTLLTARRPIVDYVVQAIAGRGARSQFLFWAVVKPLALYWQVADELTRSPAARVQTEKLLGHSLATWILDMPVPREYEDRNGMRRYLSRSVAALKLARGGTF